jgi:Flp pilus assembly protein TadG
MSKFLSDIRAAAALEFALVAPVFFSLLIGIVQLGMVFFANAGLSNAVAEGARHATLHPRPTEEEVEDRIEGAEFGLNPDGLDVRSVTYDVAAVPSFAEIEMTYTMTLNFIVTQYPVTLTKTRRAYLQPLPAS